MKAIILAVAVVFVVAGRPIRAEGVAPATSTESTNDPTRLLGAPAPPFSAPRLDGGRFTLDSLRGHVVLLDFWAVNCPPCRIEMPELEKIHRRYSGRGLRTVGVTEMDPKRDDVVRFLNEIRVTYPILLDPGARIGALYSLEAHPTTLVIDARGVVRYVNSGYLRGEEKEIEGAVEAALATGAGGS